MQLYCAIILPTFHILQGRKIGINNKLHSIIEMYIKILLIKKHHNWMLGSVEKCTITYKYTIIL